MSSPLTSLLAEYNHERPVTFNIDQFSYILNLFPSLIVCMCDGVLDPEEWEAVEQTTKGLIDEFGQSLSEVEKDLMSQNLLEEFKFLIQNQDKWKEKFLGALRFWLLTHEEDKEFVLESMYLFANIADGISEVEQKTIDELSRQLNLTS